MRLLLDSTVLEGFLNSDSSFLPHAQRFLSMSVLGDAELWITSQSLVYAYDHLNGDTSSAQLLDALSSCVDTFRVCALDGDDVKRACELNHDNFEDCLSDLAAQKVKAEILITLRDDGYDDAETLVMTPAEFFEELEENGIVYSL